MSESGVKSFGELLREVNDQISIECFDESERDQVLEICAIIAEIYRMPPALTVSVGGQQLPAAMVAEVFSTLNCEHVRAVMRKYSQAGYRIRFKKTYLRTALYNEIFEHESDVINLFEYTARGQR